MRIKIHTFCAFLMAVLIAISSTQQAHAQVPDDLSPLLEQLTKVKLKQTATLLDEIASTGHVEAVDLFSIMLNGRLYYDKQSRDMFELYTNGDGDHQARALFDKSAQEQTVSKSDYKKIRVNNKLRSKLRELIASVQLSSNDVQLRRESATTMIGSVTESLKAKLSERLELETDKQVSESLGLAIAVYDLNASQNIDTQLSAINTLKTSLNPEARNALTTIVEAAKSDTSKIAPELESAAQSALNEIDKRVKFYGFLEQIFFGLSLGSVLLLAAIGLSITFGVMGVINMAHGEMMMLGAYTTYVIQLLLPNHIGLSILLAIPAAFCVSGFVGILIERGVIQFLKGRPLETLLATFGISLILQQLVRTVFSPLNRQVITPDWLSGSLVINEVFSITYNRLYILIFALLVFVALQMLLKLSKLGLNVRAVSQNRSMARAMGIRTERVDAMTFGLGSGVAGIAGVALSQLTNVGPNLGQSYIIDSFMVVVFGGVGNLAGTVIGSFSLGIANKFLEPATGAVMANIIILVFIILFIQRRPQGLFPQKGRAADD